MLHSLPWGAHLLPWWQLPLIVKVINSVCMVQCHGSLRKIPDLSILRDFIGLGVGPKHQYFFLTFSFHSNMQPMWRITWRDAGDSQILHSSIFPHTLSPSTTNSASPRLKHPHDWSISTCPSFPNQNPSSICLSWKHQSLFGSSASPLILRSGQVLPETIHVSLTQCLDKLEWGIRYTGVSKTDFTAAFMGLTI